jgi:uncharacterized phage protein gp47/JayE
LDPKMQLSLLTFDQIVAMMTAAIQAAASSGGFTINMNQGSAMLAFVRAIAGVYLWLQWLVVQVLSSAILMTASAADVDSFCGQFGCARLPGVPASGEITLSRYIDSSNAIVPVGAMVKTTDGTQSFTILADNTNACWQAPNATYPGGSFSIPAGTASLTVTCSNVAPGIAGNVVAGAIGLVASVIPGVDTVTNNAAFTNGINPEADAAYKARFGLFLPALARATPAAIQSATLGVAQNITCAILNCTATIGGSFQPGYGVIAVDDGSGATPSSTLTAVAAAASGSSIAALGATISVVQAIVIEATVEVTIICATPAAKASAQTVVQAAIYSYIGALAVATPPAPGAPPNGVLAYNMLPQIIFNSSSAVMNISGLTVNGGTADIGGSPGTVVRVASVTVS